MQLLETYDPGQATRAAANLLPRPRTQPALANRFVDTFGVGTHRCGPLFYTGGTLFSYTLSTPIARAVVPKCGGPPTFLLRSLRAPASSTTKTQHLAKVRRALMTAGISFYPVTDTSDTSPAGLVSEVVPLFGPRQADEPGIEGLVFAAACLSWAGVGCPDVRQCGFTIWLDWWRDNAIRPGRATDAEWTRHLEKVDRLCERIGAGGEDAVAVLQRAESALGYTYFPNRRAHA